MWTLTGSYTNLFGLLSLCSGENCVSQPFLIGQIVAAVLVLVSIASYFGPRTILYAVAVLSALLAGFLLFTYALSSSVDITLGMLVITLILSLMGALRNPRVSEQSHPMNLPVFG